MKVAALQRKVETLEKAVLKLRFQLESHASVTGAGANGKPVSVTFSPKQFGLKIGRSDGWVRREITHRRIKAYGPPWLIPGSELVRFL